MIAKTSRLATALTLAAALSVLGGCAATKPPALSSRKEPAVVLCTSERTDGGGLRIVGRLDPGIYPITRTAIEYTIAEASEAPPVSPDESGKRYLLTGSRTEAVSWRKGSNDLPYTIPADSLRRLAGKVVWYRWLVEYEGPGTGSTETDVHRTSVEEAGLPRSASTPGPDGSIAMPASRKKR